MRRPARIDPTARRVLQAIGAGRIAIGLGAIFATRPALRWLGFAEPGPDARALARMAGGRDIALGVLTLAAAGDRGALRAAAMLGVAVDGVDAFSFAIPLAGRDGIDRAALLGSVTASGATATGAWATWRLA